MNNRLRKFPLRSMLSLVLFGALVGVLATAAAPLTPLLAEPAIQEAPTVKIYAPEKGALIEQKAGTVLTISGFAWDSTNNPGFPDDPVLNPISNPTNSGSFFVTWAPSPGALAYTLVESTSPYFDENVVIYDAAVSPRLISGKINGTYYYRLQALNPGGQSRWSNTVSTIVGTVVAGAAIMQLDLPLIQVSINGGTWQTATVEIVTPGDYWRWSYDWNLPESDGAVYTIRARGQMGAEMGPEDSISITVDNNAYVVYLPLVMRRYPPVPYPPVLNEISNADLNGDYTVSWAYNGPYDVPMPTSYTLQEAPSADFSTGLQEHSLADGVYAMNITGKLSGTYYYRVRGNNANGDGEWSNIRSVLVSAKLVDDFSTTVNNWPQATYKRGDGGDSMQVGYVSGTYRMKIMLATADQNNYKMGLVKAPDRFIPAGANYDLTVIHYFAQAEMPFPTYKPLEGKAGLVFAANTDYNSLYVFEWNWEGMCAINRYTTFSWPVSGYQGFGGSMVTIPIRNWASCANLVGNNYNQNNRLLVEVRDNRATLFVYNNNTKTQIYSFTDDALRNHRRVGLITGSWKWTPVESRFDDFTLEAK
ncbi:MAG: hypothetical protein BWY63_01522 [Chloroflexi bacterium ADurb.Bin360]|nr:MAG: hypothetical protein BWY63_01522 [Chloroflexi bacterium ADurb.Bin360]